MGIFLFLGNLLGSFFVILGFIFFQENRKYLSNFIQFSFEILLNIKSYMENWNFYNNYFLPVEFINRNLFQKKHIVNYSNISKKIINLKEFFLKISQFLHILIIMKMKVFIIKAKIL